MAVFVESILFNVDPAVGRGALNLRVNAFRSVGLPEWDGAHSRHEDAAAAYAISGGAGGQLVVQVSLRADCNEDLVWVRALDVSADRRNLLGSIQRFRLEFRGNEQRHIRVPIKSPDFTTLRCHNDVWEWQYTSSPSDTSWMKATTSNLRIYSLLSSPNSPWNASSGNSYLWPWREVLDVACEWACGATTPREAAERIGKRIYDLRESIGGLPMFRYDIRDTNSTFVDSSFDCAEFLRTLKSLPQGVHKGACTDYAAMLISLANAVGCDLKDVTLRRINGGQFATNPVLPIGRPGFEGPFHFTFHEIGFEGAIDATGIAWDCCLQLDRDLNPFSPPQTAIAALGMRFGDPGTLEYVDRLVQPHFETQIVVKSEQPNYAVTPPLEVAGVAPAPGAFVPPADVDPKAERVFISGLFLNGIELEQWVLRRISFPRLADGDTAIDSFWERNGNPRVTARLVIEIEETIREAQDKAVRRIRRSAGFSGGLSTAIKLPAVSSGEVVIITAIGNLSILCQNVGFEDQGLGDIHDSLGRLFALPSAAKWEEEGTVIRSAFRTDFRIDFRTRDGSVWFKVMAPPGGNLFSLGDQVYFTAGPGEKHRVDVYEMRGLTATRHYAYEFCLPPARPSIVR